MNLKENYNEHKVRKINKGTRKNNLNNTCFNQKVGQNVDISGSITNRIKKKIIF